MTTLYELTTQQLELKAKLLAMNFDEDTVNDTLESESGELLEKIEGYGFVIREESYTIDAMDAEIKRMTDRRNSRLKQLENIQQRLLSGMVACNIPKHEFPMFTVSVRDNPKKVEIVDESLIPAEFMRTPEPVPLVKSPDKKAILDFLKEGEAVAGCKIVQTKRIVIK